MLFLVYLYVISVIVCGMLRLLLLSYSTIKTRVKRKYNAYNHIDQSDGGSESEYK